MRACFSGATSAARTDRARDRARRRIRVGEGDVRGRVGTAVGAHDLEARFGAPFVAPGDARHRRRVLGAARAGEPVTGEGRSTVRIETRAPDPSACSAARASAPGSGVAASCASTNTRMSRAITGRARRPDLRLPDARPVGAPDEDDTKATSGNRARRRRAHRARATAAMQTSGACNNCHAQMAPSSGSKPLPGRALFSRNVSLTATPSRYLTPHARPWSQYCGAPAACGVDEHARARRRARPHRRRGRWTPNPLAREGLRAIIAAEDNLSLLQETAQVNSILASASRARPDVIFVRSRPRQ